MARGRSLLVADTPAGEAGERLYAAAGYTRAGVIPRYQRAADGHFVAMTIFYRQLETRAAEM